MGIILAGGVIWRVEEENQGGNRKWQVDHQYN